MTLGKSYLKFFHLLLPKHTQSSHISTILFYISVKVLKNSISFITGQRHTTDSQNESAENHVTLLSQFSFFTAGFSNISLPNPSLPLNLILATIQRVKVQLCPVFPTHHIYDRSHPHETTCFFTTLSSHTGLDFASITQL